MVNKARIALADDGQITLESIALIE